MRVTPSHLGRKFSVTMHMRKGLCAVAATAEVLLVYSMLKSRNVAAPIASCLACSD